MRLARAALDHNSNSTGENRVFHRYLSLGIIAALGTSAPALAAAQARPATTAAAPGQQAATRAGVLRNLDANFKAIDTNGDGTLSSAELGAAEAKVQQQRLNMLRSRVEAEFARLDTNKDGTLTKVEFMAAAPARAATPPNGAALLGRLDRNKDGRVSADEYRSPALTRFDALDTNKDGTISPTERQAAQTAQRR